MRFLGILAVLLLVPGVAQAKKKVAQPTGPQPWCAPEFEAVTNDACFLDGEVKGDKKTLVIFLTGVVAKNTTWSWNHERMVSKLAKGIGFDAIFPRAPETATGYAWPGSFKPDPTIEQGLIDGWMAARKILEGRRGRPYDEVFVMGFSSGAYFTSSLAMRGRMDVDGYASFCGGQSQPPSKPVVKFAPAFVGVCADDPTTASNSRSYAASLAGAGIPNMVSEQHVGHGLSHVHMNLAIQFLRRKHRDRQS